MHLCHGRTGRELREGLNGETGAGGWVCVCAYGWGGVRGKLMKNERMRRLGKLPRQQWPPCDNKERGRNEKSE